MIRLPSLTLRFRKTEQFEKSITPENHGNNSLNLPVISEENFEEVANDAEQFRESLAKDISLSNETIAARNVLFLSTLLTVIAMNSQVKGVDFIGFKLTLNGVKDLRILSLIVNVALAVHYIAAAFSEYLAEHITRSHRSQGITKHLDFIELAEDVMNDHIQRIKQRGDKLSSVRENHLLRLQRLQKELATTLAWLRLHNRVAIIYNIATPFLTLCFVTALLCWTIARRS